MTISLEQLADGSVSDRNFQKLASLVADFATAGTTSRSVGVRFGTTTLTWAGATQATGATTVTHGLGKAPVVVVATPLNPPVNAWVWTSGALGATTFALAGQTAAAAPAAATTMTVGWVAIG